MRERRIVVTVNQIVRYAGMLGFDGQNTVQNFSGLLLVRVALVIRHHPSRNERQRIEDRGLMIFRVTPAESLHRIAISERARPMVKGPGVFIEGFDGRDVVSLTLSARADGFSLLYGGLPLLQFLFYRRRPDGMVVTHRNAPVAHTALLISDGNLCESFFGLLVLERMEPGDRAIELPLRRIRARDGKVNLSEFVLVLMRLLRFDSRGERQP